MDLLILEPLELMWEAKVPSKIKVFTWRLLINRLSTRDQLIIRDIIQDNEENMCSVFGEYSEDVFHLFFCVLIFKSGVATSDGLDGSIDSRGDWFW